MENIIKVDELSYWYSQSEKKTLDSISMTLKKGDFLLLCGESGSGKSTLAKCLCGTVPNFYGGKIKGQVFLKEKKLKNIKGKDLKEKITLVFQEPERQIMMNKVHREIAFGIENLGIDEKLIKRRVMESLQFCGILSLAYKDINTLSGGEKQKVNIASALAYRPDCIMLDEPTSQLDPSSCEEIINIISKINEELGTTIVVIEQRIEGWFSKANSIAFMKDGRLIFKGKKEDFIKEKLAQDFLPDNISLFQKLGLTYEDNFKNCRYILEKNFNNYYKINGSIKARKENEEISIKVEGLNYSYGKDDFTLKDINFNIKNKDILSIIGPNGSGKSTLLKSLVSILKYKGKVGIFGKEARKYTKKDLSKTVAYVSQNPNDYISKDTVYEELQFTLHNFGIQDTEIISNVLKKLGIYNLKYKNPRDLSGGEKQRVAIASMLVLKPKILLLDEPTKGLHLKAKNKLKELLRELQEDGTSIVIVTHDMEFAADISNKFLVMFNGELASFGYKEEILSEGIYYTTNINKLFRNIDSSLFTLEDIEDKYILEK